VDYGDFILHVFEHKARRFYDLERLWRDAPRSDVAARRRAVEREFFEKRIVIEPVALSDAMREVVRLAGRVAATDANVLVTGESGTGKDALALFIHGQSSRAASPFVKIDCATLPADLLEAELSVMKRGRLPAPVKESREGWKRRIGERWCSMRSPTSRSELRQNCCA